MHENYEDIRSRIVEEPSWFDQNGTPRYGKFTYKGCPNIYAKVVVLLKIACQDCGKTFNVEMHAGVFDRIMDYLPPKWHYGDPPAHGCVGDTMNCKDLEVLEVWKRSDNILVWRRRTDLEGIIE